MIYPVAIAGILFLVGFFALFFIFSAPSPESALLTRVTREADSGQSGGEKRAALLSARGLGELIGRVRKLVGSDPNPEIARRLALAGYRKPEHVDAFLGVRLLLPALAGTAVAFVIKDSVFFWFVIAVLGGFFAPDLWLTRAVSIRRERVRLALPDALDLLAICMEAGLGLDQAIVRVGHDLRITHPEISEEFMQVNLEQRAGNPRVAAWRAMADRVSVETVRSFVNMLVQTERFGTPISRSLGVFADALRTRRRQEAEEKAAKTTIKLVLPLVFFIFPGIFIVTVAPAVIQIMRNFGKLI